MASARSMALPGDQLTLQVPRVSRSEFTVGIVESDADFAAMREEWNELLSCSRSDCLFLTWEWLHTWWRHLGAGKSLFVVTLRAGRRLVAIAPLTLTRDRLGPLALPMLEFAGTGMIGSDYLDFIVRRDCESAALQALIGFLADRGLSLRLHRVNSTSALAMAVTHALMEGGWQCLETLTDVSPFIDLTGLSWETYLNSIGPRHRYNFRRRLRNLQRDFAVSIEYAGTDSERRDALRHLVDLHLIRWQEQGGSTAFCNPNLLCFHEELSALALERGWLRLLVMKLDGAEAAAFYGFRYGRTLHFYQSGFHPAYSRHSIGLVTIGLTIRDAISEGASEYDLLHGAETYKSLWTTQARELVRLELYPPGRMGRAHWSAARVFAATKKLAKRVLKKDMVVVPPEARFDVE